MSNDNAIDLSAQAAVNRQSTLEKLWSDIRAAIDDSSKLTVMTCVTSATDVQDANSGALNETINVDVDGGLVKISQASVRIAALTEIALDSDTKVILPIIKAEGEDATEAYEIDEKLLAIHEQHVSKALEARQALLDSVINLLKIDI